MKDRTHADPFRNRVLIPSKLVAQQLSKNNKKVKSGVVRKTTRCYGRKLQHRLFQLLFNEPHHMIITGFILAYSPSSVLRNVQNFLETEPRPHVLGTELTFQVVADKDHKSSVHGKSMKYKLRSHAVLRVQRKKSMDGFTRTRATQTGLLPDLALEPEYGCRVKHAVTTKHQYLSTTAQLGLSVSND